MPGFISTSSISFGLTIIVSWAKVDIHIAVLKIKGEKFMGIPFLIINYRSFVGKIWLVVKRIILV